jgi:predicted ester cyclase
MHRFVLMILALGLLFPWLPAATATAAAQGTPEACAPSTPEENAQVVRDWYAAIDARDIDAFDDVMAPVIVQHAADFANAQGLEEVKANFGPFLAAFSDLHHELVDVVAADDLVAVRVEAGGINQGEFMGLPASGDEVTWTSLAIYRIDCGKIAEHWSEVDAVGRLQNLGAIDEIVPPADGPAAESAMASPAAECAATTPEENVALVTEWLTAGQGGEAAAHGAIARALGADTTAALAGALAEAFPDLQVTADMAFAQGDRVVVRWTASGTQSGAFQDFAASGNPVSFTVNSIYRVACGEVAEAWTEADLLNLLRQIGAVTWPPAPAATPQAG